MKFMELTQKDIPNYLQIGVENAPCILYGVHDKDFAWICKQENCNYNAIEKEEVNHINIQGNGSTIICSAGDLDFGFFGSEEFCVERLKDVSEYMSKVLKGGRVLNNDFMYDGNKYGAYTSIRFGDTFYIGVHLSNYVNNKLIDEICTKEILKKPSALPVKITREDIPIMFARCIENE